ncbi:MAG: leucine-rich repeat protein [Treponema sp.]|nr:leucine-rich repeat protein [Treponema sp.]
MSDFLVPCIIKGITNGLLKVIFILDKPKDDREYVWEKIESLPGINDKGDFICPEKLLRDDFDDIYNNIKKYFIYTFLNSGHANPSFERISCIPIEQPIEISNYTKSALLGVYLAAVKNICDLPIKEKWKTITVTGTFKKSSKNEPDGILELEEITEIPKKIDAFKEYVKDIPCETNNEKHLFIYISNNKTPEEENSTDNISVKRFSPETDTIFDILDFVFDLNNKLLPSGFSAKERIKDERYYHKFEEEINDIKLNYNNELPSYENIKLSNFLNMKKDIPLNKPLYINEGNDGERIAIAIKFVQYMIWNRKYFTPIWINIKNKSDDGRDDGISPPIEFREELSKILYKNPKPAKSLSILAGSSHLIILNIIPDGELSSGFFKRIEAFYNFIKDKSRIIIIGEAPYNKNLNWLTNFDISKFIKSEVPNGLMFEIIEEKYIKITRYIGEEENLNIPDAILGLPVTSIGKEAFKDKKTLENVIIPLAVVIIEDFAFMYCENLKYINFPQNIITIGAYAFYGCENLKSIMLPPKLTVISNSMFNSCRLLEYINIPDSITIIEKNAFRCCSVLKYINIPNNVNTIGEGAFAFCDFEKILIPPNVTSIGKNAFYNCSSLSIIILSPSITSIEDYTFSNCYNLNYAIILSEITKIGYEAFFGCKKLKTINVPSSVIVIKPNAFLGCNALKYINFPLITEIISIYNRDYIYKNEFIYEHIIDYIENALDIQYQDNAHCNNQQQFITFHSSLITIGKDAFKYCNKILNVYIYKQTIAKNAFDEGVRINYYDDELLQIENNIYLNDSNNTSILSPTDKIKQLIEPDIIKISVIGVGGAGCNFLHRIDKNTPYINTIAIDTDSHTLQDSKAKNIILIGKNFANGRGSGGKPENGEKAAKENEGEIKYSIKESNIIFITAGFGGGTGSGACSVVAQIAKELRILTIVIYIMPFYWEGEYKNRIAKQAIDKINTIADVCLPIENEILMSRSLKNKPLSDVNGHIDEICERFINCFYEVTSMDVIFPVKLMDLFNIFKKTNKIYFGTGKSSDNEGVISAIIRAMDDPFIKDSIDFPINKTSNIIIFIRGWLKMTKSNNLIIHKKIKELTNKNVKITLCYTTDDSDGFHVSIIILKA